MSTMDISVIVPIVERHGDLSAIYEEFSTTFGTLGKTYEFIFVVDGGLNGAFDQLKSLQYGTSPVKLVKLSKPFGESVALLVGLEKARGAYIFTVPPFFQVDPHGVATLWEELCNGYDLVVTRRHPRIDSRLNRLQSRMYHWLVAKAASVRFNDMSCGLKAMKRTVLEEVSLYGGMHRFIPILANKHGFKIKEIDVPQRKEAGIPRFMGFRRSPRYLLDVLIVLFITRFTMTPLRFFGGFAGLLAAIGGAITAYLGIYRLLGYGPIANRPLLLLGVLLMALGIQILSIGLIGELIIFIHARQVKQYKIEEYLE